MTVRIDEISRKTLKSYNLKAKISKHGEIDKIVDAASARADKIKDDTEANKVYNHHFDKLKAGSDVLRKRERGLTLAKRANVRQKSSTTSNTLSKPKAHDHLGLAKYHHEMAGRSYEKAEPHIKKAHASGDYYGRSAEIGQMHTDTGDNHSNKRDHHLELHKQSIKEETLDESELDYIIENMTIGDYMQLDELSKDTLKSYVKKSHN